MSKNTGKIIRKLSRAPRRQNWGKFWILNILSLLLTGNPVQYMPVTSQAQWIRCGAKHFACLPWISTCFGVYSAKSIALPLEGQKPHPNKSLNVTQNAALHKLFRLICNPLSASLPTWVGNPTKIVEQNIFIWNVLILGGISGVAFPPLKRRTEQCKRACQIHEYFATLRWGGAERHAQSGTKRTSCNFLRFPVQIFKKVGTSRHWKLQQLLPAISG